MGLHRHDDEDLDPHEEALVGSLAAAHPALAALPPRDAAEPTLRELDAPASDGFDENGMGPITIEPSNEPDPLAEAPTRDHLGEPDPSSEDDYGSTLARDDAEPLGSIGHDYGANPGQMVAPSGAAEDFGGRIDRLEVGGDFAPVLPAGPAEPARALASPFDDEADDLALAGTTQPGDEPEAVHNPAEEAAEMDAHDEALMGAKPPRDEAREAAAGPLRTLDEGLPSEHDIAAARDDVGESILHRIANALRGATGQPLRDYNARGDALQQQRSTGMERRQAAKGAQRSAEATALRAEARQAQADELAQQRLALQERGVAATEAMIPARQASMQASTERTQALTEDTRADTAFEAATRGELDSSESGAANAERAAIAARLAQMNAATRADTEAAITAEGDIATMDANELHRIREALTAGVSLRGGGRGGTGGGGSLAALRERAIAHGVDAGDAAVLLAADLRREIGEDIGPTARAAHDRAAEAGHGVAILPGVYADPEIISSPVAQRSLHGMIVQSTQHLGALERVRQIGEEYGRTGFLDPRAEGELVGARSGLMAMVASLENSGIIGPSDMPRILAAVPNPADFTQANLGTLSNRLNSFQQEIDRAARIHLRGAGVTDEGLEAAIRFMHGGGSAPARTPRAAPAAAAGGAAPSGPVTFRDENGEEFTLTDPADIAEARDLEWAEVE